MAASATKILTLSVLAQAALQQCRAVTATGALPAAGARCAGFTDFAAAIGERVGYCALGTTVVEAGAAFPAGSALELDAQGRVIARIAGVTVAHALEAAGAVGQRLEALIVPN
jgi:hypothetical protein